jgi:hypothetical protein
MTWAQKDCVFSKITLDAPSHMFSLDWASCTLANLCHQLMKGTRFYKKSKIIKKLPQHWRQQNLHPPFIFF